MGFPFLLQKKGEGMSSLRTDYKDDVFTGKRKYNEIDNGDGSISFDDVTNYTQQGDTYGAAQINEANDIINNLDNNSYRQTDGAETAIADNDYFPFFDTSANAKKKTLWSNLKSILTQVFAIKIHNSNSAGTYGGGNASYFGHVKLSDNYASSAGAASTSIGASSQAVYSTYNKFKTQLTANSKEFYFDYKNGKYGYNTSANRGADTFFPFKSGIKRYNLGVVASGTNIKTRLEALGIDPDEVTANNFFAVPVALKTDIRQEQTGGYNAAVYGWDWYDLQQLTYSNYVITYESAHHDGTVMYDTAAEIKINIYVVVD